MAVLVLLAVGSRGRSVTLLQPAAGPLRKGAMVSMDVPAAQLATAKIGDIVQGQMKAASWVRSPPWEASVKVAAVFAGVLAAPPTYRQGRATPRTLPETVPETVRSL